MELPSEIWGTISGYLSVSDKCSMVATCRSIQQTLYNDPFWLDFTLKNLLRGLTIEEIIIIVFLKADQQRMSKSRISKIQNYLKIKYSSSLVVLQRENSTSALTVGANEGVAWRERSDYSFAFNFVALFCNMESLNVKRISEVSDVKKLLLHGEMIKHFSWRGGARIIDTDFTKMLPNLTSVVLPEFDEAMSDSVMANLPTSLTKLEVSNRRVVKLGLFTRLVQLRSFKELCGDEHSDLPAFLQAFGSQLESLKLPSFTDADVAVLEYCSNLKSLRLPAIRCPDTLVLGLTKVAQSSPLFPKTLKIAQKRQKKSPQPLVGADKFIADFGHRLKKLTLKSVDLSTIEHLGQATNLIKLSLTIIDPKSKVNGAANIKVPQVVAQLVKLEELTLELSTEFGVELNHSHLTKLTIHVPNTVINIPSLVHFDIEKDSESVHLSNCAPKKLVVGRNVRAFTATNINWRSLEELRFDSEHLDYWTFIADLPKDLTLTSRVQSRNNPAFREIDNESLMPGTTELSLSNLESIINKPKVLPRELVISGPPSELINYKMLVDKFELIECLDFYGCHNITTEALDILCKGLPNLKQIGFTESRDVTAPFSHLKLHSKSLELIYLYHIHSVETSDIVCPNLRTITFDNAGRYNFLEDVTDTNFCEMTLQQLGESNACPNLVYYTAYPTQTHPDSVETMKKPSKPVTLTAIPRGLIVLDLYLNSNLVAVDLESNSLRQCSISGCYHVKSIKLKADVHSFNLANTPALEHLTLRSKLLKEVDVPHLQYLELVTPNLRQLQICAPTSDHFLDHLVQLEELKIYEEKDESFKINAKTFFAKLLNCCPQLKVFEWTEKCLGITTAQVKSLKEAYKQKYNRDIELRGPKDLLEAVEHMAAQQKLPEKKQRMIRINTLMKRTITNWKQKPKAKAFRAWRDYALRDKKHDKK